MSEQKQLDIKRVQKECNRLREVCDGYRKEKNAHLLDLAEKMLDDKCKELGRLLLG